MNTLSKSKLKITALKVEGSTPSAFTIRKPPDLGGFFFEINLQ